MELNRIDDPHDNDVLFGRGGHTNGHPGNQVFRSLVQEKKIAFNHANNNREKRIISQSIVCGFQNLTPPGRFIEKQIGSESGWQEVDMKKAMKKTSQALREKGSYGRSMSALKGKAKRIAKKMKSMINKRIPSKRTPKTLKKQRDEEVDSNLGEKLKEPPQPPVVPMSNGQHDNQLISHYDEVVLDGHVEKIEAEQNTVWKRNTPPTCCASVDETHDSNLYLKSRSNRGSNTTVVDSETKNESFPPRSLLYESVPNCLDHSSPSSHFDPLQFLISPDSTDDHYNDGCMSSTLTLPHNYRSTLRRENFLDELNTESVCAYGTVITPSTSQTHTSDHSTLNADQPDCGW
jgi:hypothetical protein